MQSESIAPTGKSLASAECSEQRPLPARRTKLVFLYSSDEDEDDDENGHWEVAAGMKSVVVEEAGLNPPMEELSEMQQAAMQAAVREREDERKRSVDDDSVFVEDVAGMTVERVCDSGFRVKVVDAPPLWSGACVPTPVGGTSLRDHLRVEEAERIGQIRKRFREEAGEESTSIDNGTSLPPRPVVDDDGCVRAVEICGYTLTVDEREMQECSGGTDNGGDGVGHLCVNGVERCDGDGDGDGGDEDFNSPQGDCSDKILDGEREEEEEEEDFPSDDEEDEELDDVLVVAVVEQLVRCCESDELDEALRDEGRRFVERARPALDQLHAGETDPLAFGEALRPDILRLQHALSRVKRPVDAPIVIDGVPMDL
ncbi:hypothetical protein ERJ75_001252800 [Trypanosoma vivax]|uniref:Uncharacterized protein n=1 Tax=Trypanosoma vivax (strain Y486) TaxID=1055687 RepID=G0UD83_TRYVY|nr:hypothetical protein ERJ75_001252800 [Trypanosoma vivax]CCC53794.1 conserved hypothetical protein [Trypanosoma vivax Y486]